MLRIGLTGGIGSGKSMVANRFAEHGAVVIDADRIAREVVEPGTEALREIVVAFGVDVLTGDGVLDRARLAGVVFADQDARARLNAIVHPRVAARTTELLATAAPDAVVVHDVPLLVENGLAPAYHLVIVVDAPVEVRVARLVGDRHLPEEDARARIAAQATEAQRRAVADVWLDNAGARDEVLTAVDALWADRLVRYEANVRLHREANYGSPRLVDYDPSWPAQAERLMARVRRTMGELALRVDHVGSTAVPGMAAKDVIDLQVAVASLADAEVVAEALSAAGFVARPSVDLEVTPGPDHDATQWRTRYHCSADPGRPVNLYLREHGSAGWLFTLRFRDWLRAEAPACDEYLSFKRSLAGQYASDTSTARYAEAKQPWFSGVYPRVCAWAERTGWRPR